MKAIDIEKDQLILKEFKNPIPGAGEVLIKVAATAVNRADLVQRSGAYPPPRGASQILGLECSGEVMALGDGEEGFKVGDKVAEFIDKTNPINLIKKKMMERKDDIKKINAKNRKFLENKIKMVNFQKQN